jgi:hypothetical protein
VERVASRAAAVTVGAQCLRLWTLPFAWLLPKAQQQQKVRIQVCTGAHWRGYPEVEGRRPQLRVDRPLHRCCRM